jgi:hypothetical protein
MSDKCEDCASYRKPITCKGFFELRASFLIEGDGIFSIITTERSKGNIETTLKYIECSGRATADHKPCFIPKKKGKK